LNINIFLTDLSHFLFGWDSICSPFELQHRRVGQFPPLCGSRIALDFLERPVAGDRHDLVSRGAALRKPRGGRFSQAVRRAVRKLRLVAPLAKSASSRQSLFRHPALCARRR
jgi:hypothetical protein